MALTPKQEKFSQSIADGMNQSDAYRAAFNAGRMKPETINNSAYKLMQNGEVTARLAELRKELSDKGLWSREDSIKAMIEIIREPDNQGCKISAVKVINDMQGFNAPTKAEHSGDVGITLKWQS